MDVFENVFHDFIDFPASAGKLEMDPKKFRASIIRHVPRERTRYKRMALKHHPDKGGDAEMFKAVTRAFENLSDQDLRRECPRDCSRERLSVSGFELQKSRSSGDPLARHRRVG